MLRLIMDLRYSLPLAQAEAKKRLSRFHGSRSKVRSRLVPSAAAMATTASEIAQQIKNDKAFDDEDSKIMMSYIDDVIKGTMPTDQENMYKMFMIMSKAILDQRKTMNNP